MLKFILAVFLVLIAGLTLSYNKVTAKPQLKIYVVHSYDLTHFCGSPQYQGFKQKLAEYSDNIDFNIRTFYMNTRTINITPEEKSTISKYVITQIDKFNPDYIVTIDDAAFEYVGIPLSNKYKIIFSGINLSFAEYLNKYPSINQKNIFGVEELFDFSRITTILLEFSNIYILTDDTDTSKLLEKNFKEELSKLGFKFTVVKFETIQDLHKFLLANENTKNNLYLVTTQSLYNKDNNKYILFPEILRYINHVTKTIKNPSLIITGNPYSTEFVHLTVSPDFTIMGATAADLLLKDFSSKEITRKIITAKNIVSVNKNLLERDSFEFILTRHHQYIDKVFYY